MNKIYRAELKEIMMEVIQECASEKSCPLLSSDHAEQHKLISEWIDFFTDTRIEMRQSFIKVMPRLLEFFFWSAIIGAFILISAFLVRLGIR